jgi:hypothetical protein
MYTESLIYTKKHLWTANIPSYFTVLKKSAKITQDLVDETAENNTGVMNSFFRTIQKMHKLMVPSESAFQ